MSDDTGRLDRRTVLKALGTTAAVGTGLAAGTVSAAAEKIKQGLASEYTDEEALREAFERHGDGLLAQLHDAGMVDESFDFQSLALDVDIDVTGLAPTASDGVAGAAAVRERGTFTALGVASTSSDTHDIALYVQPQRGEAYARVTPKGGGNTYRVSGDGVSPSGCLKTECGSSCSTCYDTTKYYDCDDNCENCSLYDTDCSCCDCGACPCCSSCDNDC